MSYTSHSSCRLASRMRESRAWLDAALAAPLLVGVAWYDVQSVFLPDFCGWVRQGHLGVAGRKEDLEHISSI